MSAMYVIITRTVPKDVILYFCSNFVVKIYRKRHNVSQCQSSNLKVTA